MKTRIIATHKAHQQVKVELDKLLREGTYDQVNRFAEQGDFIEVVKAFFELLPGSEAYDFHSDYCHIGFFSQTRLSVRINALEDDKRKELIQVIGTAMKNLLIENKELLTLHDALGYCRTILGKVSTQNTDDVIEIYRYYADVLALMLNRHSADDTTLRMMLFSWIKPE